MTQTTTTSAPAFDVLPYHQRERVMQLQQARVHHSWHYLLRVSTSIEQAREAYGRVLLLEDRPEQLLSTDELWQQCQADPELVAFITRPAVEQGVHHVRRARYRGGA